MSILPKWGLKMRLLLAMSGVSLLVHVLSLVLTSPMERTHDVAGHLAHIEYVARNLCMPQASDCWECYQPPMYYALGAVVVRGANCLGLTRPQKCLQVLSLLCYCAFLTASVKFILEHIQSTWAQLTAVSIVLFWPSGFFHSVRIGNDNLLYAFHGWAIYFVGKWSRSPASTPLYLAAVMACFALLTKANGILTICIVATVALLVAWRFKRLSPFIKVQGRAMAALFSIGFGVFVLLISFKGMVFSNSSGLSSQLRLVNSFRHLFGFDFGAYFGFLFVDPWSDPAGRQYFFNYVLKTSLFGEFGFDGKIGDWCVPIVDFLALNVVWMCCLGIYYAIRKTGPEVAVVNAVFLGVGLLGNRLLAPFSCSQDFRYILPIIISVAVLFAESVAGVQNRSLRIYALGVIATFLICGLVCICSALIG